MLKRAALLSMALLLSAPLCAACSLKKEPADMDPPVAHGSAPRVLPPSQACLDMARRVAKCAQALQPALAREMLKYAATPTDPHTKGAVRRMQQFFIDAFYRSTSTARISDLVKYSELTCENTARAEPHKDVRKAFYACVKTRGCQSLGPCLVKQGAYVTLLNAAKKSAATPRARPSRPRNLLYHWAFLAQLSSLSALAGCSCPHWLANKKKQASGAGPRSPVRKPIPVSLATCKPYFQRPLKCAEALWTEALDRNRRSSTGNLGLKDTSLDPAEARRRLKVLGDKLTKSVVNPSPGHPFTCSLDRLKEMPKNVQPVIKLIAKCAAEKTCKDYAACLRRGADLP